MNFVEREREREVCAPEQMSCKFLLFWKLGRKGVQEMLAINIIVLL